VQECCCGNTDCFVVSVLKLAADAGARVIDMLPSYLAFHSLRSYTRSPTPQQLRHSSLPIKMIYGALLHLLSSSGCASGGTMLRNTDCFVVLALKLAANAGARIIDMLPSYLVFHYLRSYTQYPTLHSFIIQICPTT
jgi:hypothetical protein